MGATALVLILSGAGGMAYIRLAPDDPLRWHVDPQGAVSVPVAPGQVFALPEAQSGKAMPRGGAYVRLIIHDLDPVQVLTRLDRIALATPHTTRLAGSAGEGRITWVTRSAFWGFPDYTTAEAVAAGSGTNLTIFARQRYGRRDFGVNEARLRDWLAQLQR